MAVLAGHIDQPGASNERDQSASCTGVNGTMSAFAVAVVARRARASNERQIIGGAR
jgi:hypothetical protein